MPLVRVRIHWVHRVILGALSMIVAIGVVIVTGTMVGGVHGGPSDSDRIAMVIVAAIILVGLPFLFAAIGRKTDRRGASDSPSDKVS